ncbi:MAG: TadE family protein, partial [Myxococcota bacterium]
MNRRTRRVGGQSAIEFLIVSPLILVLMMGGLQFALLYRAKLTLNLATFEAARRGAVSNATWASMDRALTMSMGALYAPGSDDDTRIARGIDDDLLDRGAFLASARENVPWWGMPADANDSPVCIERLNPPDDAFAAFGYPGGTPGGPRELPNDNLAFRTRSVALSSGSQLSIQDLNLL